MKKISWVVILLLMSAVLPLFAAPLKAVRTESYRPDARRGAEFKAAGNSWSVKLDKKTGDFGKWTAFYLLPEEAEGCLFRVRHNAGKDAVLKNLIVCTASWLDKNGNPIRTAYLEPGKDGVFSGLFRRPAGAVQASLSMGVRYFFDEVTFADPVCDTQDMLSRKVRIVVAKNTPAGGGKATCDDNQKRMEYIWKEIERVGEKPDLVVFPETLLTRWVRNLGVSKGMQTIPGPHTAWAASWAKKMNTNVVVSLREDKDGQCFNSAVVIDRSGRIVGVYRKTQLCISEYGYGYDWGPDLPVFDLDFGKIGVLICWDLWFPEAIRTLRLKGAEIIAYPIASTSRIHFDRMWRTRAMENGVVLAASISGGDSCPARIVTPDGEVQAETYYPQTFAAATVDLADLPTYEPWLSVNRGAGDSRSILNLERHPELYRGLSDRGGLVQGEK